MKEMHNNIYDFLHNEIKNGLMVNMTIESRPNDPTGAYVGQMYFNTGMERLRVYNGASWQTLSVGAAVMKYKGTVTDWSQLPISGMEGGDYWINSTTNTAKVWNDATQTWDDAGSTTLDVDAVLSETSINPVQNRIITVDLNQRLKKFGNEPVSGEPFRFIYYLNPTPQADKVTVTAYAMTLDNNQTPSQHSLDILPATQSLAGLLSAADKTKYDEYETKKLDVLGIEAGSGGPYRLPYFVDIQPKATEVTLDVYTISLDNQKTLVHYPMHILPATQALTGLLSAADKVKVDTIDNRVMIPGLATSTVYSFGYDAAVTQMVDKVQLAFGMMSMDNNETTSVKTIHIGHVTDALAGVMSPTDKVKLDRMDFITDAEIDAIIGAW